MKSVITLFSLLLSVASAAQVTVGVSTGYSSRSSIMGNLHVGYQVKDKAIIEYDQRALLDAAQPAYFGFKAAYRICLGKWDVAPAAGYYFKYQTADDPSQNSWLPGTGILFLKDWFRGEIFYQHNSIQVTVGAWGIFRNNKN